MKNLKRPIIIAGPCSAESLEQTVDTCSAIAKTGKVDILRVGVWKPRTNPGSFEGVGKIAFSWIAEAKKQTGLPAAVEVANAHHVELALANGIDYLWIGARTTVSPFSVQEIADTLKGTNAKVFIKNPINPDIALWTGAIERLVNVVGTENVGMIHRGFSYYGNGKYRNAPLWHLIIEMRRRFPEMLTICDPSHICGKRSAIFEVSQQAADLNFDGLIIESHVSPENALSDAEQQLTPSDLESVLNKIKWRKAADSNLDFNCNISKLRSDIDQIDIEIFELLSQRMKIVEEIGKLKSAVNVAILQGERWQSIVDRFILQTKDMGLSAGFVKTILDAIHLESIDKQNKIMNK